MDWGELLNNAAQGEVMKYISPKPQTPTAIAQGGQPYLEGKPAAMQSMASVDGKIFGLPKMVVYGGGIVALIGLVLMMRK